MHTEAKGGLGEGEKTEGGGGRKVGAMLGIGRSTLQDFMIMLGRRRG